MVKYLKYLIPALIPAVAAVFSGCSDPEANPFIPPPPLRDGVTLDLNAASISPDPSGKPWLVSSDWVIPAERTVTIQPGTEIMFDSLWWITVDGQIIAEGEPDNPIIFTSAFLEPKLGQWRGFQLKNTDPGRQSVFKHCIFSYGAYYDTDTTDVIAQTYRGMLGINNSSPTIERCIILSNQNNAVYMTGPDCAPTVRYNIFTRNDASAVRADLTVNLDNPLLDVSYNCVGENSSIPFIMGNEVGSDSARWGRKVRRNPNLDSCDLYFNIDMAPLMSDPVNRVFALQSCSPCVDAGPVDGDFDGDGTRADMGSVPYVQVPGELRGVIEGVLNPAVVYRISCNVRVDSSKALIIPAGTVIEAAGRYSIEVHGRLEIQGTAGNRARIQPTVINGSDFWAGLRFFGYDTLSAPSVLRHVDLVNFTRVNVEREGVVFTNCLFERGYNYGLRIATGKTELADSVAVDHCTFRICGEFGIEADSSAVTIRNTLIENGRGRGIALRDIGTAAHITNCIVRDNALIGLLLNDFCSPVVVNNVFARNGYYGVQMVNNCLPTVLNNIVVLNTRYGFYVQQSSVPELAFNDVYGHFTIAGVDTSFLDYVPNSVARTFSIGTDPRFVSAADFHLAAGSPCINAGSTDPAYNDGDGSRNDMGAYGGPAGNAVGTSAVRYNPAWIAAK